MDQFDQFEEPSVPGETFSARGSTTIGIYYLAQCEAVSLDAIQPGDILMTTRGEFHEFNRIESGAWQAGKYSFSSEHPTGVGIHFHIEPDKMPKLLWKRISWEQLPRPEKLRKTKVQQNL